jgi:predicted RNA-binding protein with PIN domain
MPVERELRVKPTFPSGARMFERFPTPPLDPHDIIRKGDASIVATLAIVMRWLIDGYNVMHAGGRIVPGLKPEPFRRARRRFLDDLADALAPETANETTVVFDANSPPTDFPLDSTYRGMRVIFALGDESADARIETLIAKHGTPKTLTTVSTDRRIRQAATRRRGGTMTADQYWQLIDDRKERIRPVRRPPRVEVPKPAPPIADESAFWLEAFAELNDGPEVRQFSARDETMLTDAEIEQIEREVEREFHDRFDPLKKKGVPNS